MKKVFIWLIVLLLFPISALADLQVYFLDVGQGDSTIVVCDGESMIVDGGLLSASDFLYSFIRDTLKLDHMDYMISTHPHEDHVGGLAAVLNAVPVDLILTPTLEWDSKKFESMITYAKRQGTPISIPYEGDTLQLGEATVTILHCWPEARDYSGTNDMSIVVRIDYGQTCFSNWYPAEFDYVRHFTSSEQFMMYHKVLMFHKYDPADQILKTSDPAECKKIAGQKFPEFNPVIWEKTCYTIVKRGVKAKFSQNKDILKSFLRLAMSFLPNVLLMIKSGELA